jgi:hypothetical protein
MHRLSLDETDAILLSLLCGVIGVVIVFGCMWMGVV